MVVDIHAHFVPRGYLEAIRREGPAYGATLREEPGGDVTILVGGRPFGPITRHYWDTEARLADMDAAGVDVQAVSLNPPMVTWAPPEVGIALARLVNDEMAKGVGASRGRLQGLATLPMQDVPAAGAETERAVRELGLKGVYIGTHVGGVDLDDPRFDPLYARWQDLDVPVFLHPIEVLGGPRVGAYHLHNLIGNPTDTTVAAERLIFGGVFARFPRLKVVLAHGGGTLPYLVGRMMRGYAVRTEARAHIGVPPTDFLGNLYYDTITHDLRALGFLVDVMGPQKVLLGSDYRFDMADPDPVRLVRGLKEVGRKDRDRILGGNAARLLKL